jgi:ATP-binding cassette subfamily B protein
LEVVKAFNQEDAAEADFLRSNDALRQVGVQAQIWSGFMMPLMNVINNLGIIAVSIAGALLTIQGRISVGLIASFLSYTRQFTRPLNELANIYNTLQTALAGAERVFEIMDTPEEAKDVERAQGLSPRDTRGEVEFQDVTFAYTPGVPVVREVSFKAEQGSVTALVGPTGAGKTTIVNLLSRFYDVSSGSIRLDGLDLREYKRNDFRQVFGIVLQDSYLFSGTIGENILYGKPDAGEDAMRRAAEAANAAHFIECLPKGYMTELQEGGYPLSAGQRQLVAIARAVLADPRILILDEATSSVDTRTELHIQKAMIDLMAGRTSFIIAHRLSTIRGADRILVIDDGRIVESGNHQELIAAGGLYAQMYAHQE